MSFYFIFIRKGNNFPAKADKHTGQKLLTPYFIATKHENNSCVAHVLVAKYHQFDSLQKSTILRQKIYKLSSVIILINFGSNYGLKTLSMIFTTSIFSKSSRQPHT